MVKFFYNPLIILFLFMQSNLFSSEIFYVDMQYILENSKINENLKKDFQSKEKDLNKEILEFKVLTEKSEQELIAKKNILSQENLNNEISLLKDKIQRTQEIFMTKEQEILKLKKDYLNSSLRTITEKIIDYANQNSIKIILDKKLVLIGDSELDITKEILNIIDK
jgi:Skp family chaperone for outer membrane proteins